ncbi:MAG: DUF4124 domain-containing protein [Chromatiales bacterium]
MRGQLLAVILLVPCTSPGGTVYKCVDPNGRVTFSDTACTAGPGPRQTGIRREDAHLRYEEEILMSEDPGGGMRMQRRIVMPDPDARPGLREGEKRMLNKIDRDERLDHFEKEWERRQFLYEHETHGERVQRRNEEMHRRNEREARRRYWRNHR